MTQFWKTPRHHIFGRLEPEFDPLSFICWFGKKILCLVGIRNPRSTCIEKQRLRTHGLYPRQLELCCTRNETLASSHLTKHILPHVDGYACCHLCVLLLELICGHGWGTFTFCSTCLFWRPCCWPRQVNFGCCWSWRGPFRARVLEHCIEVLQSVSPISILVGMMLVMPTWRKGTLLWFNFRAS